MISADSQLNDNVIQIRGLSRRFGDKLALNDVALAVPRGAVYGLIGANGAGKTTLIRHILGTLKPQWGSVEVFGLNPIHEPVRTLGRIGYVSEDRELPNWMKVGELMRYTQAFYRDWDEAYADELCAMFELSRTATVRTLSRGQRARASLLVALAHRPELLVLDEPSSGLDPIVRRDILGAIIRTIAEEGRTILFSSHLLDEVERVADHVAMVRQGKIVMTSTLDGLKASYRRYTLQFPGSVVKPPSIVGMLAVEGKGNEWSYTCNTEPPSIWRAASILGATIVEEKSLTLEEIFVSQAELAPATEMVGEDQ